MSFKSMLNEIGQELPALNLTGVLVVFGIGFSRLIYKLVRLAEHKCFAKRFLAKYTQMLNDEQTAAESYEWLLDHLSQIKREMRAHGDSNYAHISHIISTLHDRPPVLAPNLDDVCVDLRKYIGTLSYSIRIQCKHVWRFPLWPIVLPMQVVELVVVDIILRFSKTADFNSHSSHPVIWTIKIIFAVYTFIAGWDAVVKKIKEIF